jgi:hypothetical protein
MPVNTLEQFKNSLGSYVTFYGSMKNSADELQKQLIAIRVSIKKNSQK